MKPPTMIARALGRSRSLPPGRELLEELQRLGYPRDVRLGVSARDDFRVLVQCVLWTAMCAVAWNRRPDSLWNDAPVVWAGGIVIVGVTMLIVRSRARFTFRASGIELQGRGSELIAWDAIRAAGLERSDLVIEHEQGGRRVTSKGFIGYPART